MYSHESGGSARGFRHFTHGWWLTLLLTCTALCAFAQPSIEPRHRCGFAEQVAQLEAHSDSYRQQAIRNAELIARALPSAARRQGVVTIPVVFHVVYHNAATNISEAQVLSQLQILNEDFRRTNADHVNTPVHFRPLAADTQIEFRLATYAPDGRPTTGITRTHSTYSGADYNVKLTAKGGVDAWNSQRYLNIWIDDLGRGLAGYATPPGSPAAFDGVVVHYQTVGAPPANPFPAPYNRGRTATHEVGHWLGLKHIWGTESTATCTDSDGIHDTPNQLGRNTGCPTGVLVSCPGTPFGDLYMNYMDYADDACMNLFTQGQADYMHAVLSTLRTGLHSGPTSARSPAARPRLHAYPNPVSAHLTVDLPAGLTAPELVILNQLGQAVTVPLSRGQQRVQFSTANLAPGLYYVRLRTRSGWIAEPVTVQRP